jgi:hypothetical protein
MPLKHAQLGSLPRDAKPPVLETVKYGSTALFEVDVIQKK